MRNLNFLAIVFCFFLNASLSAQKALPIYFSHGTEFFSENFKTAIAETIPETDIAEGKFVRYVQVSTLPNDAERAALERTGVSFIHYIDQNTYLLSLPEGYDLTQLSAIRPLSIVAPQPTWKMHRNLKERPLGAWAVSDAGIEVELQLLPHISIDRGARLLEDQGIQIIQRGISDGYLRVRIQEPEIAVLAAMPAVLWVELIAEPAQKEDNNGRSYHRSNQMDSDHPLGKKYNGNGVNTLAHLAHILIFKVAY